VVAYRPPPAHRRETPDVVRPRSRIGADTLTARYLRHPGEVLAGLPREIKVEQHLYAIRGNASDPEVIHGDEGPDAAADANQRNPHNRDAGRPNHRFGPGVRFQQLLAELTARRRHR